MLITYTESNSESDGHINVNDDNFSGLEGI